MPWFCSYFGVNVLWVVLSFQQMIVVWNIFGSSTQRRCSCCLCAQWNMFKRRDEKPDDAACVPWLHTEELHNHIHTHTHTASTQKQCSYTQPITLALSASCNFPHVIQSRSGKLALYGIRAYPIRVCWYVINTALTWMGSIFNIWVQTLHMMTFMSTSKAPNEKSILIQYIQILLACCNWADPIRRRLKS